MKINEFISHYKNHPVLFIGAGISLRYLKNSYSWNSLLSHICKEFKGAQEYYLDIKSDNMNGALCAYESVASCIEKDFNDFLKNPIQRNGRFKKINDIFYDNMNNNINLSRFKIFISTLLSDLDISPEKEEELSLLKKTRKNIGSIVTTNYDELIEKVFDFNPLIGNDILLSNPYGSVYKIHGCVSRPDKIIITKEDYQMFGGQCNIFSVN